ncbi:MAG: hypothetical protein ACPHER_02070 [Nevskiales bacterium]
MHRPSAREWIGKPVHFRGGAYIVHEVIDADSAQPQLVLRGATKHIQPDQWGDAHRRVPETVTVALYDKPDEGTDPETPAINPELEYPDKEYLDNPGRPDT